MRKNGILTFFFAFCPGAGQMYQGYMKRGLSLITMFCLFLAAGSTLLDALAVGCAIVWMYSFFDTFNLRAQIGAGTAPKDDYLVHINWNDNRMQQFMMDSHKLVGWALIALGAMVAYQNIVMNIMSDIVWRWGQSNPFFRALYLMMDALPETVVCVALIICGVWLVRGPGGKKNHRKSSQEEPEKSAEAADFREYEAAAREEKTGTVENFDMPELSALLGDPVTPEAPEEPDQTDPAQTEETDGTEN